MNTIEETASDALRHLRLARSNMQKLLGVSQDGVNQVVLDASFEELEKDCRHFMRCRLFLSDHRPNH